MKPNSTQSFFSGIIWTLVGQFGYMLTIFISNIFLARILSPEEFGKFSIVMFFITISSIIVEGGIGGALVIKKDVSPQDYSTAFIFNLAVSLGMFVLLYISANLISNYYNDSELSALLRLSGVIFIFNALQVVNSAKLIKYMLFKQRAIYRFFSILLASIVGIVCALKGFGVWSLLIIQLLNSLVLAILLLIFVGSFPIKGVNKKSFSHIYHFGIHTTLSSLMNSFFDNIYQLILARYATISEAGYYYNSKRLQDVPNNLINLISQGPVFSLFAKSNDNMQKITGLLNKIVDHALVLMGLISSLVFLYASQILTIVYGKEWVNGTFYLKVLIITSFFYVQELIFRSFFKSINKTKYILKLEFIKKACETITILISIYFRNIELLFYSLVVVYFISCTLNFYQAKRVDSYLQWRTYYNLLKIIMISVFCSLITNISIYLLHIQGFKLLYTVLGFCLLYLFICEYTGLLSLRRVLDYLKIKAQKK